MDESLSREELVVTPEVVPSDAAPASEATPDRSTGLHATMGEVALDQDDRAIPDSTEQLEPILPPSESVMVEPAAEAAPQTVESEGVVVTMRGPSGESNVRITRGYVVDSSGVLLTEKEVAERNRTM